MAENHDSADVVRSVFYLSMAGVGAFIAVVFLFIL
jgi:hypothetical protein